MRIVAGDDGATAARAAGYGKASAHVTASRMLKKAKITLRVSALKKVAQIAALVPNAGPMTPDVSKVVLSRKYILDRLLEIQAGARDGTALAALVRLGQEEFQMFVPLVAMAPPGEQTTDELTQWREKLAKKAAARA